MFFNSPDEILEIAGKTGTAIFVMPSQVKFEVKNALVLEPTEKSVIAIEQVKEVLRLLSVKQTGERHIIIRPAEALSEESANALLKSLEEPGEKVHFILITDEPSYILPTILSRAALYFLKTGVDLKNISTEDVKIKEVAKKLLMAKPADLPALAEELTKKKEGVRAYVLSVLATTIEMLYKSYFLTEKEAFIKKLPKFLSAYEAISLNGHIKLHLVADLI